MQNKIQVILDNIGRVFIAAIFIAIVGFSSYIGYNRLIDCNESHSFLYCMATQKNWVFWDHIVN